MDKPIAKPSIREGNERAILAAAEAVFAEQRIRRRDDGGDRGARRRARSRTSTIIFRPRSASIAP